MSHDDSASFGAPVDRRKLLGSMAAAVALGLASPALLQQVSAQATPEAEGELPAVPPEAVEFASDWPMAQGNFAATRAAAASTIDSSNVGTLEVAWTLPLDAGSGYGAITSNPLILGDTVFIIDQQGNVQSLDRETGSVNWRTDFDVPTTGPNGIAIGYGRLISVLGDTAEVVCLDPATGEEQWRFQLANHNALGITMAPAIFDGIVYVSTEPGGNTKGNYEGGAEGILFALDITNGVTLWQWNTVKDDAWGNWNVNSGGGLWYPPSVDVETGILYAGIGNAAPFFGGDNAASRPGDNDYANNVVAINPAAGHIEWAVNVKPHDLFDHDNQHTPVLADVPHEDIIVKMVFTSGKHGLLVGLDRTSGIEVWRTPVGRHKNDTVDALGEEVVEVFPGVMGGVESPLGYQDSTVFVTALNASTGWSKDVFDYGSFDLTTATGNVVALDAWNGQIKWDVEVPTGIAGPGVTIANDILFTGGLDGIARAYSLTDGSLVWSWQAPAGLNAPFAIAGDLLLIPAGTFFLPSSDTEGDAPQAAPQLVALKLPSA